MSPWQLLRAHQSSRTALGYHLQHGAAGTVHYSTAPAPPAGHCEVTGGLSPSSEKQTMQQLNMRLASYLQQVELLSVTNQRLEHEIQEELRKRCPTDVKELDQLLRSASFLQEEIMDCLSARAQLNLQLLAAELAISDLNTRSEQEHQQRSRVEAENSDLRYLHEVLNVHKLPELQEVLREQRQELQELQERHLQDKQALLNQVSGGVSVAMQTAKSSELIQQLDMLRRINAESWTEVCSVQEPILQAPDVTSDLAESLEVAELEHLRRTSAHLTEDLKHLQRENAMLETSGRQQTENFVVELTVLQETADCLCLDLDSVLQAADQQAAHHEVLLDVKSRLEAEIQDYMRLLDSPSHQGASVLHLTSQPAASCFTIRRGNIAVNTLEAVRGGNMSSNLVQMFSSPAGHNVRPKKTAIISSNVSNQSYSFQSALSRTGWDSSCHKNLTSQQNSSSVQSQAKESDKQASVRASEPQTSSSLLSDTKLSQTFDPPSKQQNYNFTKVEVEQIVSHEGPKLMKRLDLVTHKSTINADKHSAADIKKETKTVISASIESFSQANNNLRQDASQESESPQEVVRDEGKVFPASVKLSEVSDELNLLDDKDTGAQDGNVEVGVETRVTLSSSPAVTDATESKLNMEDSVQENGGHSETPTESVESLKVDVNRAEVIDESRVVKVDPPEAKTESAAQVNFKTSATVTTSGMSSSIPQSLQNEHIKVVVSPESVQTSDRSLLKFDESISETVKKIPAEDNETVEKIPAEDVNETVKKIPAEDVNETVKKIPAEDNKTVQMILGKDNEAVKKIPAEEDNETLEKISAEDNETVKMIPAEEDNETVNTILAEDNETVKTILVEDDETVEKIPAEDNETIKKIPAEDNVTVKTIPAKEDKETVKTIPAGEDIETVKTILAEDNETVEKIPAEDNETIKKIPAEDNEMLKKIPAEDKETLKTIPAEVDNETVKTIVAVDNETVEKSLAENNEIIRKIQAEGEKEAVKTIPAEDKETVKTIPAEEDKETVKTILAVDNDTVKKIPAEDNETVKKIPSHDNETLEKIPAKNKETVKTILAEEDNETVKKIPAEDKETEEVKETVKTIMAEDNETVKTIPAEEDKETVKTILAEDNETIKKIPAENNEIIKKIQAEEEKEAVKTIPAEDKETVKTIPAEEDKETVKTILAVDNDTVKKIPAEDKETVKTILAKEHSETVKTIPAEDKETVKTILTKENETVEKIPAKDKETVKTIPAEEDKETLKTILAEDNETVKKIPAVDKETVKTIPAEEDKETPKTILAEDNETVKKIPAVDKETVMTIPAEENKETVKTILAEDNDTVKKIPAEDKETVKTIMAEEHSETVKKIPAEDKETVKTILTKENETVEKIPAVDKETVKTIPAEEDKETVKTILAEDNETVKKIPAVDKETVMTIPAEEDKETVKTILAEDNDTVKKIPAEDKETVKTILAEEDNETVKKIPAEDKETVKTIPAEEDKETLKTILAEDNETVKKIPAVDKETVMTIPAEEDKETVKTILAEDNDTVKKIPAEDKETVKTILAEEDNETAKKIPAEDKETVKTILGEEHSETVDPSEQTVLINMTESKISSSTSDSGVILNPAESLTLTETHFSPADAQPWIDSKNVERQGKREEEETGSDLVVDRLEQSPAVNREKLLENEDTSAGSDSKESQSAGSDNVKVKVEEEEQPSDSRDRFTDSAETDKELVELPAQQESKGLASNSDSGVTLSFSSKENNLSPKELVTSENQAVRLETSLSPADVLTSPNDPTLFPVDPDDNVMSLDRPKDLETFLSPSDTETFLSPMEVLPEDDDSDDDDDACLTEANALVIPVETYILSTKDEDNIVPEIGKRTDTAGEDKFKVFEESKAPNVLKRPISQEGSLKKASSGGVLESGGSNIQSIIADKEKQLGFEGLYRRPVRTAGRSLEEYKSEGDIATRASVPAGRISTSRASDVTAGGVRKGSGEWIVYGSNLRQSNEITSEGSALSTSQPRPGRFGSGEWIVYGSDLKRKSSLDGVGTSVNEGNDESISRFGTSAPETRRFGRRSSGGSDEWIVHGGGVGHKSNAGSTQTQSVERLRSMSPPETGRFGQRSSGGSDEWIVYGGGAGHKNNEGLTQTQITEHLRPMSPPETGRFGRRSSGGSEEWIVYGGGAGHKNNEGLTQTQITEHQRPMSPPETGRLARRNSSDWIVYGGTGGRPARSDNYRWPEGNDHLTAAMKLSLSPPGSVGAAPQLPLSPPGSVGAAPQLPMSPPGSTRFGDGSGEWRVYGGSGRLSGPPSSEWRVISPPGSYTARGPRVSNTRSRLSSRGAMKRSSSLGSGGRLNSPVGNQRIAGSMDTKPVYSSAGGHRSSSAGPGQPGQPGWVSQSAQSPAGKSLNASPRVPGGWLHSAAAAAHRTSSIGSGSRSSTGGSGNDRISGAAGGRVSVSSGSGRVNSTGGRVITSSDRPIRSTGSGSGSHKERISVCKMAALLMSAAGRERSKDKQKKKQQQQQQQQQAKAASPLLQRWLTTGVGVTSDDVENPDDIMNL